MPFIRRVLDEVEARLTPGPGQPRGASGKCERKRYGDETERLKVRASGLSLRLGARVQIVIADEVVAEVGTENGGFRYDIRSPEHVVPPASSGDRIEVRSGGAVLLEGEFVPD